MHGKETEHLLHPPQLSSDQGKDARKNPFGKLRDIREQIFYGMMLHIRPYRQYMVRRTQKKALVALDKYFDWKREKYRDANKQQ